LKFSSDFLLFCRTHTYRPSLFAVIFANSQAIILLVGKVFSGSRITLLEAAGALTAFGGAVLCSKDSASSTDTAGGSKSILGDVIATLGALSGVFYIICATSCRAHFSLFNFMFLIMVVSTAMTILFQILTGEEVTFGMDRETGIWGFLQMDQFDRLPLEFVNVVVWYVSAGLWLSQMLLVHGDIIF